MATMTKTTTKSKSRTITGQESQSTYLTVDYGTSTENKARALECLNAENNVLIFDSNYLISAGPRSGVIYSVAKDEFTNFIWTCEQPVAHTYLAKKLKGILEELEA